MSFMNWLIFFLSGNCQWKLCIPQTTLYLNEEILIGVNIVYCHWVILKLRRDVWHFFQLSFKPWNDLMVKLNNIHGEQTILFDLKHTEEWFVKEQELWDYCETHGNFLRRCCGLSIEQQENWSNSYPDLISLSLGRWHLIGTVADSTLISTE